MTPIRRRHFWQIHAWLGLISGIFVLIVSITGGLLAFHDELDSFIHPALMRSRATLEVAGSTARRTPLSGVIRVVEQKFSRLSIDAVALPVRTDDAIRITGDLRGHYSTVFVDAYSAEVLGARKQTETVGGWLLQMHYTLLLSDPGEAFLLVVAASLVISSIAGLVITRRWWRTLFTLPTRAPRSSGRTRKRSPRVWLGDWHRWLGLWSLAWTLMLGATGCWLNRFALLRMADRVSNGPPARPHPPRYDRTLNLDSLVTLSTICLHGFVPALLSLPASATDPIMILGHMPSSIPFRSQIGSSVSFDQHGGGMRVAPITDASFASQLDDAATGAHFGQWGNWLVKLMYLMAGVAMSLLTIGGACITLLRGRPASRRGFGL